jgi:hypothetical protein
LTSIGFVPNLIHLVRILERNADSSIVPQNAAATTLMIGHWTSIVVPFLDLRLRRFQPSTAKQIGSPREALSDQELARRTVEKP